MCVQINFAFGQNLFQLKFISNVSANTQLPITFQPDVNKLDSISCIAISKLLVKELANNSYLLSVIDTLLFVDTVCEIRYKTGPSFKWVELKNGNIPEEILVAAGWRQHLFYNTTFNYRQYVAAANKILTHLELNGYPFAQIKLDSIDVTENKISAYLMLDRGDRIYFDSIEIIGDAQIKGWFIAKYLGIKKDALYNESLIQNAFTRLNQLPIVQVTKKPFVYFIENIAKPVVYLKNRKSSVFDGILGLAPASDNNRDKLLLTGEVKLLFQNLFSTNKEFELTYKSFLNASQELKTKIKLPYIFRTNIGLDYELNFVKFDSTYIDVRQDFGIPYRIIGNDYLKVLYSNQFTSLIQVDTNLIILNKKLPSSNDMVTHSYGLGGKFVRYDYVYNPFKGFGFEFYGTVGTKKIIPNAIINQIKYPQSDGTLKSIYDTMQLSSTQYKLYGKGDVFIPLTQRTTIHIEASGGFLHSQNIFFSELFRIGGIRTLKGFDEQSIFASGYLLANSEIRYLLQQNSNVLLFWNGAWYINKMQTINNTDKPFGFGAGLNFETNAGIFSLYYAVGKQFNNPLAFDKAKIHFGFINYF